MGTYSENQISRGGRRPIFRIFRMHADEDFPGSTSHIEDSSLLILSSYLEKSFYWGSFSGKNRENLLN